MPVRQVLKSEPLITDTADPFVLVAEGRYYVFSTNNRYRMPVRTLGALNEVALDGESLDAVMGEAMPERPRWAANDAIWAPTVARVGKRYLMYFTGQRPNAPKPEANLCIGRAWSERPEGPFIPDRSPWHCGLTPGGRGALDPEIFVAPDGRRYVLMTFQDSNDVLWSVRIDGNGDPIGDPRRILRWRYAWHGLTIENPTMVHDPSRNDYVLFHSAGRWHTAGYVTGISRCSTPLGPCADNPHGPWLVSGNGRTGPGGLSVFTDADGVLRAAFHTWPAGREGTPGGRELHIERIELGESPRIPK